MAERSSEPPPLEGAAEEDPAPGKLVEVAIVATAVVGTVDDDGVVRSGAGAVLEANRSPAVALVAVTTPEDVAAVAVVAAPEEATAADVSGVAVAPALAFAAANDRESFRPLNDVGPVAGGSLRASNGFDPDHALGFAACVEEENAPAASKL